MSGLFQCKILYNVLRAYFTPWGIKYPPKALNDTNTLLEIFSIHMLEFHDYFNTSIKKNIYFLL